VARKECEGRECFVLWRRWTALRLIPTRLRAEQMLTCEQAPIAPPLLERRQEVLGRIDQIPGLVVEVCITQISCLALKARGPSQQRAGIRGEPIKGSKLNGAGKTEVRHLLSLAPRRQDRWLAAPVVGP